MIHTKYYSRSVRFKQTHPNTKKIRSKVDISCQQPKWIRILQPKLSVH